MPDPPPARTLYLIDISSFIFRAYHSVGHLSTADGTPTGAVFGAANMLVSLFTERAPTHVAVAMDSRTPTFRKDIYPAYKANRPPPPDDLKVQFPLVREVVEAFDLEVLQKDGFEADDLIATATRAALEAGLAVVVVSGDKDLMQLVGPFVTVLDTMKGVTYDAAAVEAKWGVPPALMGDLLALTGDSSDNIPGVPRVGPKTAALLLKEHGDLETLLANPGAVKQKAVGANLVGHAGDARLSRRLVTLDDRVPVEISIDRMRHGPPDPAKLSPVLDRLEFRKLKERLFGASFSSAIAAVEGERPEYSAVTDPAALKDVAREIRAAGRFAVDLETTSVSPHDARIVGVSLAWKPLHAVYVPVAHKEGPCLPQGDVLRVLGPLLTDPRVGVVAQNVKFEDSVFRCHGIRIANVAFDPMLASYLLRGEGRSHGLKALSAELLGRPMTSYEDVTGKGRGGQLCFDEVSVTAATAYSGADAEVTLALADRMEKEASEAGLGRLLHEVEIPLARVLCGMELAGIMVDVGHLEAMSVAFGARLDELTARAHEIAGREFNLASPKQLQEILFDELKLPSQKKTKTGQSTDFEVLEALEPLHELPRVLLEHRMLAKLKGTYLDALPKLVHPVTGRIHTSFNQAVAATGRLSSSNPNLQNIPVRTDLSREIRRAFVAAPGHVLVSADYSQIELRVLAHLAHDDELIAAFRSGVDVHERTARAVFGYGPLEQVDRLHRAQAKTVNFGVIYGKTEFSLAKELGIPRGEARRFIDGFFELYGGVRRYMDDIIEKARRDRRVETLLGRRRELRDIDSPHHVARQAAERMARNTPIQGTAADLLKVAMIRVDARLERENLASRMLLTVHDELVVEAPQAEAERAAAAMREEMEHALELDVPLVVDIGTGANWADAH
ncbi:MAG: DNA polymerase I [Deltaproteobacteria bacterium]|nr:DNA polymerase I [Deltaproteobacteria bacterium]